MLGVLLAQAQTTPQKIADWTSTGLVLANVAGSIVDASRAPDKRHAFGCLALKNGIEIAATRAVKRLVHKTRPDGSDRRSFWSGHTSSAMVNSGWSVRVGASIALGAGASRILANRHDVVDVLAGAGAGYLTSLVCRVSTL